uniref:Uncharacterized protein n=1 Tax=uncultured microorganism TaxID=358574 RepID=I2FJN5_9ZZZZ|nr:hypothetical protein [uncultured microorganism]
MPPRIGFVAFNQCISQQQTRPFSLQKTVKCPEWYEVIGYDYSKIGLQVQSANNVSLRFRDSR